MTLVPLWIWISLEIGKIFSYDFLLYLIFEKSSWKNQVRWTGFLSPVHLDLENDLILLLNFFFKNAKKNKHERDFVLQVRCRNLNNSCDKITTKKILWEFSIFKVSKLFTLLKSADCLHCQIQLIFYILKVSW